jgi:hypothetical protein
MQNGDYIGYKKTVGDLASSGTAAAASAARVAATGGTDISADIALVLAGVQFAGQLWNQFTARPAADARDFIKNLKPKIVNLSPYERITYIMAGDTKINKRAKDVSARELVLWYRGAYPNDYKTLSVKDKTYFNNYLLEAAKQNTDVNQASRDYQAARFTVDELNYNATPLQSVTNLFSSGTGKTNWVLYGAIGLGIILLIKYIKK